MAQNIIDKVIGFFSPESGVKRVQARHALSVAERKYDAATNGRRWPNNASQLGPNAVNETSLSRLRSRSRDLIRNNGWAKNAVATIASNVIGTGILPNIKNKKAKRLWAQWAETTACDFYGKLNLYGIQRQVMEALVRDGEVIVRKRRSTSAGIPLKLQVQEADHLDTNRTYNDDRENIIIQGVEYNRNTGEIVGYWLYDNHPNDTLNSVLSRFVPAADVMHVFRADRPGQVRGVPWLASVMLRLKDFDEFEDAELIKQKVSACFSAFVHDATDSGNMSEDADDLLDRMEPGVIETLPTGKQITFANPPTVQSFDAYSRKVLMGIAKGIGISYEALTGDLSNVNFSSARMGWIEMQRNIEDWQWNLVVPQFCDGVWSWFSDAGFMAGLIPSLAVDPVLWTPPRREMIDPTREIPAMINAVRGGIYSLQEVHRQMGYDTTEVLDQMKGDNELIDKNGLILDSDARKTMKAGVTQAFLKTPSDAAAFTDPEPEPAQTPPNE